MKEIICKVLHHTNTITICISSIVGQPFFSLWSAEKGFDIIKFSLASFEY